MKITEYKLISWPSIVGFNIEVNKAIKDGFALHGPYIDKINNHAREMVKYTNFPTQETHRFDPPI